MGNNKRQSVNARQDGSFSKRGDGKMTYAWRPIELPPGTGIDTTVIFMWDGINDRLYAVPKGGGTPILVIASFFPGGMKCDYKNQVLFWANDSSGNGTYGGINAVYIVKYLAGTGAFLEAPILIYGPAGSAIRALWPDQTNHILYWDQGLAYKRGSYASFNSLFSIEYMKLASLNISNYWAPVDSNLLYSADIGIGGIGTLETVQTGTPPEYVEVEDYYNNGDDYDWIYGDEINDLMLISGDGITALRIMTLSNPTDMTVFHTKSNALYEPFALDDINGHIFISEYGAQKLYRYEYGTRSKVNQTEILDYVAVGISSNLKNIVLG